MGSGLALGTSKGAMRSMLAPCAWFPDILALPSKLSRRVVRICQILEQCLLYAISSAVLGTANNKSIPSWVASLRDICSCGLEIYRHEVEYSVRLGT